MRMESNQVLANARFLEEFSDLIDHIQIDIAIGFCRIEPDLLTVHGAFNGRSKDSVIKRIKTLTFRILATFCPMA